jgi:hypothetical protein
MAARSIPILKSAYVFLTWLGAFATLEGILMVADNADPMPYYTLLAPGIAMMLAGLACGMVLLYRAWACVDRGLPRFGIRRRTLDPAAAVALTLVPLVNSVGVFFSLGRLPGNLNALAQAAGCPRRAPDNLGYVAAGVLCCGLIPVVGPLIAAVSGLLLVPMLLFWCSSVAEAIEERLAELARLADAEPFTAAAPAAEVPARP